MFNCNETCHRYIHLSLLTRSIFCASPAAGTRSPRISLLLPPNLLYDLRAQLDLRPLLLLRQLIPMHGRSETAAHNRFSILTTTFHTKRMESTHPHCGPNPSCSSGANFAASLIRAMTAALSSSLPVLVEIRPRVTRFLPSLGRCLQLPPVSTAISSSVLKGG